MLKELSSTRTHGSGILNASSLTVKTKDISKNLKVQVKRKIRSTNETIIGFREDSMN